MIVIKLGGAALKKTLEDPALFRTLARSPEPLVIVHGGGPEINQLCQILGIEFDFVDGQRKTTADVMNVVEMVLTGKVNPALVRGLNRARISRPAIGLSGVSAQLLECEEEDPRLGFVGRPVRSNAKLIQSLLAQGLTPVISPVGYYDGHSMNVNADLATARIATDLKADRVLFLTDKEGILDAGGDTIKTLSKETLRSLMESSVVSGGMKVKARAILEILESHPKAQVSVMNGLDPRVLQSALEGEFQGTAVQ